MNCAVLKCVLVCLSSMVVLTSRVCVLQSVLQSVLQCVLQLSGAACVAEQYTTTHCNTNCSPQLQYAHTTEDSTAMTHSASLSSVVCVISSVCLLQGILQCVL